MRMPRWKRCYGGTFIAFGQKHSNNLKELGPWIDRNPFTFNALVALSGSQVLEFVRAPAGPLDGSPFNGVPLAHAKGYRKLGLRQITGPASHRAALVLPVVKEAHHSANRIAIRFRSHQPKPDAAISGELIVAIEKCRTVVGGQQKVHVAIAIEVPVGQSAPDFRLIEAAVCFA